MALAYKSNSIHIDESTLHKPSILTLQASLLLFHFDTSLSNTAL